METQEEQEIAESETAELDIAWTEWDNPIFPGDQLDLPESYIIPPGENMDDNLG